MNDNFKETLRKIASIATAVGSSALLLGCRSNKSAESTSTVAAPETRQEQRLQEPVCVYGPPSMFGIQDTVPTQAPVTAPAKPRRGSDPVSVYGPPPEK